jgi:hypothetical protein
MSQLAELSIHESAHALAHDALGIPLEAVWINWFQPDSKSHGQTALAHAPGQTIVARLNSQKYFLFMVGPAATLYIAEYAFEPKINRFRSDFVQPVYDAVRNGSISEDGIKQELLFLRKVADDFCRKWVLRNRAAILDFAQSLESASRTMIPGGERSELRGIALQEALAQAWGLNKPPVEEAVAEVREWYQKQPLTVKIDETPLWVTEYTTGVLEELQIRRVKLGRKVGRNEPCPCGSGKKYKKCHGS